MHFLDSILTYIKVVLKCVWEVYMKKNFKSLIFILCMAFELTGCSNESEKNGTISDTSGGYDSEVIVNTDKLYDVLGAEDVWKETISDVNLYAEINVQVEVPDVTNMMVINTEPKVYTSEEKKNILLNLTDSCVYKYDEEFVPKEDIQLEIDKTESLIEYNSGNSEDAKSNRVYYEGMLATLNEKYAQAPDEYVLADDYVGDLFLIIMNDIKFVVEFKEYSIVDGYVEEKSSVDIYPLDIRNINNEQQYDEIWLNDWVKDDWIVEENITTISEEEAEKIALEYASLIADGEFVVYDIYPLKWIGKKYEIIAEGSWYDGYVVNLCRSINGVDVDYNAYMQRDYWNDAGEEIESNYGYGTERLHICINAQGIVNLYYENPYVIGEAEVGQVELLEYSNIKDIIIEELSTGMYSNGANYKYMELLYYPIRDVKTNEYLLIPVWRLIDDKFGWLCIDYMLINAMDGSAINAMNQTNIE